MNKQLSNPVYLENPIMDRIERERMPRVTGTVGMKLSEPPLSEHSVNGTVENFILTRHKFGHDSQRVLM